MSRKSLPGFVPAGAARRDHTRAERRGGCQGVRVRTAERTLAHEHRSAISSATRRFRREQTVPAGEPRASLISLRTMACHPLLSPRFHSHSFMSRGARCSLGVLSWRVDAAIYRSGSGSPQDLSQSSLTRYGNDGALNSLKRKPRVETDSRRRKHIPLR